MDAYSYLARDKVFANAQTGNMLLFGVHLADGDLAGAWRYLLPVLSFAVGIALAQELKLACSERRVHWRQLSLVAEIVALVIVGFMPAELNLAANCLTSLACGVQVQSFRKLHGRAFATTMCIGNLRSGTHAMIDYAHTHDRERLESGLLYYGTIVCFVAGAVLGSRVIMVAGLRAILLSPAILAAALLIMFVDRERNTRIQRSRLHFREVLEVEAGETERRREERGYSGHPDDDGVGD